MYKIFYENDENNNFFSTIENKIDINDDTYIHVLFNEETQGQVFDSSLLVIDEKKIYVKKENLVYFENIIKRIQKYLSKINHCSSEKIVFILLYNFTFVDRKTNSVEKFNTFLNWKTTADINQLIIFGITNYDNFNLSFGEFTIETFDLKRLSMMCDKFGTDYVKLHEKDTSKNLSIKRNYFTIPIINIFNISNLFGVPYASTINEAQYVYFEELARYYFENFDIKFSEQQNLMTFLNNEYIDLENLKLLLKPKFISVFLNISETKEGWIIPKITSHINFNFPSHENKYQILKDDLLKKYAYKEGKNTSELENTIYTFLTFCSKAKRYFIKGFYNDCLLHYVIALDLVFGDAINATVSVSSRVSICTYRAFGKTYDENYKIIRELYSERSGYVHKGISVKNDNIEIIEILCREILFIFFRLNKQNVLWKRTDWLAKLDLLVAHLNANEIPLDKKFIELGITI